MKIKSVILLLFLFIGLAPVHALRKISAEAIDTTCGNIAGTVSSGSNLCMWKE